MFRLIFVLAFFAPTLVWSQDTLEIKINPEKALAPRVTYEHLDAGELRVAVTVSGVPVGDLGLKDLEVRTELSQYELRSVEPMLHTESAKVSIILCIDNSQSMQKHVPVLKETLEVLLRSLGPSVKIASVFFQENTRGKNDLTLEAVENIRTYGQTHDKETVRSLLLKHLHKKFLSRRTYLYDEIYAGIKVAERIQEAEQGRYVIVLSDGLDNASKYKKSTINDVIERTPGIIFYTIDYLTKTNPFLVELAENSGGRHFRARKAEELGAIFENISRDIIKLSGYRVTYRVPLAYLTGRVLGSKSCEPVSQSTIVCFPVHLPKYRTDLNVDEHGTYSGRLAFPHRWRVLASAPGYLPDSTEVEVAEETLYIADFTLSPAVVEIAGRVTDSGTAPLPQAHVMVTELESGEVLFSGVTDSSGIYRVQSQVGRQLLITATKPGYTFGMLEIDELEPNTVPADIVLGLTAEGFVSEFRFLFEFNSDRLDTADISTQTQLAGCVDFVIRELLKSPTRRVRLVGWTDNIGSAEYNQSLSQRRADYIKDYLVRREIAAERIVAEGRGISDKYNNETEAGRARNRRTDVIFFDLQEVSERLGEKR